MKNESLMELDGLVGEWNLTLSDTSFLESREVQLGGSARIEWVGEAFLVMLSDAWDLAIGRSDANTQYTALYHDPRGVSRVFEMTFAAGKWTLLREDPDFHQRFTAVVEADRITGRWDASEDAGQRVGKGLRHRLRAEGLGRQTAGDGVAPRACSGTAN